MSANNGERFDLLVLTTAGTLCVAIVSGALFGGCYFSTKHRMEAAIETHDARAWNHGAMHGDKIPEAQKEGER